MGISGRWFCLETPPKWENELVNHQWNPGPAHISKPVHLGQSPPGERAASSCRRTGQTVLDAVPQNNQLRKTNLMSCVSTVAIFHQIIDQLLSAKRQSISQTRMYMVTMVAKTNKHVWGKRTHAAQHQMLVLLWGGNIRAWGEWERVRCWLCLQAPRSWLVRPGSPNGHWFWGLRVLGLFEKDLWSRIKVIYLRTPDGGPWGLLVFETGKRRDTERGRMGEDWRGANGERGEEELCVMNVFPCLSYFEMWLNGPPSVRQVPGLRAAMSPQRAWSWKETQCIDSKCTACL